MILIFGWRCEVIDSLNGLKIVEDENMVEHYTEKVLMGWEERFFSFKWFTKFKTIHKTKPDTRVIKFENYLIMHPEIALKLKQEIDRKLKS